MRQWFGFAVAAAMLSVGTPAPVHAAAAARSPQVKVETHQRSVVKHESTVKREGVAPRAAARHAHRVRRRVAHRVRARARHVSGTTGTLRSMRFRGLDRNRDGVIERSEWRGTERSFEEHDWNHDGRLSGDELRAGAPRPTGR